MMKRYKYIINSAIYRNFSDSRAVNASDFHARDPEFNSRRLHIFFFISLSYLPVSFITNDTKVTENFLENMFIFPVKMLIVIVLVIHNYFFHIKGNTYV